VLLEEGGGGEGNQAAGPGHAGSGLAGPGLAGPGLLCMWVVHGDAHFMVGSRTTTRPDSVTLHVVRGSCPTLVEKVMSSSVEGKAMGTPGVMGVAPENAPAPNALNSTDVAGLAVIRNWCALLVVTPALRVAVGARVENPQVYLLGTVGWRGEPTKEKGMGPCAPCASPQPQPNVES
jgi:hypothetical protein